MLALRFCRRGSFELVPAHMLIELDCMREILTVKLNDQQGSPLEYLEVSFSDDETFTELLISVQPKYTRDGAVEVEIGGLYILANAWIYQKNP